MTRRVLVVDGFDPAHVDVAVADSAVRALTDSGHDVRRISLVAEQFAPFMSADERRCYHDEGSNILSDEVRRSAEAVAWADALLFTYPTVCFNPPALVKAWLDRVLLPGVAFGFDDAGRVAPGLTHIRRLGVVTTTSRSRVSAARARDGGRRMIMRAVRMNCAKTCRRSFVSVSSGSAKSDSTKLRRVSRRIGRW